MDAETLAAYNGNAKTFADDWLDQPAPDDMYEVLRHYFSPGLTADIGCGAGRDVAWLNLSGFETIGYDASLALIHEARTRYPDLRFELAALPELDAVATGIFQNVLCETVIMHLDAKTIADATTRLLQLLKPGGTLFLSWRITQGDSQRDKHERLYSAFDKALVLDQCKAYSILLDQLVVNQSSGKPVQRLVIRNA
jgi:2-polyprenyl-3-methyl-5-hydroxy-6-metoxy-1,4-benzoquinol methylase